MDTTNNTPETPESPNVKQQKSPNLINKLKSNKPLLIGVAVVVLALIGGAVMALTGNKENPQKSQNDQQNTHQASEELPAEETPTSLFLQQNGRECKERDVAFTSPPLRMEDLSYIRPLGAVNDGHVTPTDHVYVGPKNPNAKDNTYPVLMPADGTIVSVSAMPAQYVGDSNQQVASEDHRIVISHSCRYFSIYIHVHKLSDAVVAAVGDLQPNESKNTSIELKAGDIVGYIGGSTFDWTPIDTTKTLSGFITPKLYDGESWKIHTVSPYDLYTGDLKAQLEAKSLRRVAPLGGLIDYDQPGKLVGNWFRAGSGGYSGFENNGGRYWDAHLSVVPDYIDPTYTIVSIGNWKGAAKQFVVSGTADPSKITAADGIAKYELKRLQYVSGNEMNWTGSSFASDIHPSKNGSVEGTIAFEVQAGEKLKVEKFPGKTASQVTGFTSAAETYER